ncbi:unnamed protein product, partial [Rotaria magnacalcarata]
MKLIFWNSSITVTGAITQENRRDKHNPTSLRSSSSSHEKGSHANSGKPRASSVRRGDKHSKEEGSKERQSPKKYVHPTPRGALPAPVNLNKDEVPIQQDHAQFKSVPQPKLSTAPILPAQQKKAKLANSEEVPNSRSPGQQTPNRHSNNMKKTAITTEKTPNNYVPSGNGVIHTGTYDCNRNSKNIVPGYCVLALADALEHCNSDPNCGGYQVTTNAGWHAAYDRNGQSVVQLFLVNSPTTPNHEWNCFNKRTKAKPATVSNYVAGGKGMIHTGTYHCNNNSKNIVPGYCILTLADALIHCNSDPTCGGYGVTTNAGWHAAYDRNGQSAVQLFLLNSPRIPNREWNSFNKPPTVDCDKDHTVKALDDNTLSGVLLVKYCDATDFAAKACRAKNVAKRLQSLLGAHLNTQRVQGQFPCKINKVVGNTTQAEFHYTVPCAKSQQAAVIASLKNICKDPQLINTIIHENQRYKHNAGSSSSSSEEGSRGGSPKRRPPGGKRGEKHSKERGSKGSLWPKSHSHFTDIAHANITKKPLTWKPTTVSNYVAAGNGVIHTGTYDCNRNSKNIVPGYCVLTLADAVKHCNSDPNCGGYEVTTNAGWHAAYDRNGQSVVQLFLVNSPTTPNHEWNCFNKRTKAKPATVSNYVAGGKGMIHTGTYHCNNNSKNIVPG